MTITFCIFAYLIVTFFYGRIFAAVVLKYDPCITRPSVAAFWAGWMLFPLAIIAHLFLVAAHYCEPKNRNFQIPTWIWMAGTKRKKSKK